MENNPIRSPHHSCCCECHSKQNLFSTAYKITSCLAGRPSFIQNGSKLGAIANLCSATLGAGVLALPYAILNAGLIPGIVLLFLASLITVISIDWIIDACRRTGVRTYEEVTLQICGPRARCLEEFCMFIFCFGTAVAYIIAVGDILDEGMISLFQRDAKEIHDEEDHYNGVPGFINRQSAMVLFWLVVMLPLSLLDKIDGLRYASFVGSSSVAFLVFVTMIRSAQDFTTNSLHFWPTSAWNVVRAFPIIMFDFSSHPNVCAIYDELGVKIADESDNADIDEENSSFENVYVGNDSSVSCVCPPASIPGRQNEEESSSFSSSTNAMDSRRTVEMAYTSSYLDAKTQSMQFVTRTGVSISLILYILIAFFALADFGENTMDNMLKNYCVYDTRDPLVISAFIGIVIAVVIAYPLNIFPLRLVVSDLLQRYKLCCNCGERFRCSNSSRGQGSHGVREPFVCTSSCCYTKEDLSARSHGEANDTGVTCELPVSNSSEKEGKSERYATEELNDTCLDETIRSDNSQLQSSSPPSNPPTRHTSTSPTTSLTKVQHVALTIFISGSSLLVAVVVPSMTFVLGLMGGTASSIIVFVLPALFARNKYITEKRSVDNWDEKRINQDNSHTDADVECCNRFCIDSDTGMQSSNESCDQERSKNCGSSNDPAHNDSRINVDDVTLMRKQTRKKHSSKVVMLVPSIFKIVFIWVVILVGCIIGVLSTGVTIYEIFQPIDTHPTCRENGNGSI